MAFRHGQRADAGSLATASDRDLIWLRLTTDTPVAEQVASVRSQSGISRIVALSDQPSDAEGMAAFSAGCKGYCNSHATVETLQQVAAVIEQGGLWIGESLLTRLLVGISNAMPINGAAPTNWSELLTEQETKVAISISSGSSNKEIAAQLNIKERTVKSHTTSIFDKLNVRDRLQLALKINKGS